MALANCPHCQRPLAGEICPVHGYIGPDVKKADTFPVGGIIMWSGTLANIPKGWKLCDGTLGTPNLQDKFVMGGGSTAPGTTGGSNTHTHSVAVSGTTTGTGSGTSGTEASHTHSGGAVQSLGSTLTGYAGTHDHGAYTGDSGDCSSYGVAGGTGFNRASASHTHPIGHTHSNSLTNHGHEMDHYHAFTQAGAGSSHSHTIGFGIDGTCSAGGTAASGGIGVAYYTLAFIMKI